MCPIKKREYSEDIFIDVPYYPLPISSIADNQLQREPQMLKAIGKSDSRFDLQKFHQPFFIHPFFSILLSYNNNNTIYLYVSQISF